MSRLPRQSVLLAMLLWAMTSPAHGEERLGVVLMHGKQSVPDEHRPLAKAIAEAGYPVETPEMCWSARRIYDRPYLECLRDVDTAMERLRQRGATRFVMAGHSLGANGALAYAARNKIDGVIAIAPGHLPEILATRPAIMHSLELARSLVARGQGDRKMQYPDFNGDLAITVTTTSNVYLSFFAPDSPALMPTNVMRLTAPLLYIVGTADRSQRGRDYVFDKAPSHPLSRYLTVRAGHFASSEAAAGAVVAWLRQLPD
jgi:pimeloyl-ACP methyl ester carboxylesterase